MARHSLGVSPRAKKPSAAAVAAAYQPGLVDKVFTDGVLVDVNVSYWTATYQNQAADLGLTSTADIPDFVVGLGTKRLIEKKQVMAWQSIAHRAWDLVNRYSFDFPVGRGRFVPAAALEPIEASLTGMQEEFNKEVAAFLAQYDSLREKMLEQYPEHRARLEGLYPAKADLARRFSFSWSVFNVQLPKALRTKAADRDAMARYEQEISGRVAHFLEESVRLLREQVVEVCGSLAERVKKGAIIQERSLDRVRNLIAHFKMLNFTGDQSIETMLDALKKDTLNGRSSASFQDDAARTQLGNALSAIAVAAQEITDVSTVTGEYRRRIRMDTPQEGG